MSNLISLVATYKNRRHHIEQTLHTWVQDADCDYEIVIVDYESDDDIKPLITDLQSHVIIKHIKCRDLPVFNLSHARNIGSNHAEARWIMYVDIDCKLNPHSLSYISDMIVDVEDGYFGAVDSRVRKNIINGGLMLVPLSAHMDVCGFNENMKGWGFEDIDYRQRLEARGLKWNIFPHTLYECIDHEDSERIGCYDIEKELSWTRNRQISLETWKNKAFGQWNAVKVGEYGGIL